MLLLYIVGLCVYMCIYSICVSIYMYVSFCQHVFSRTAAVVDTKRGYVGMCNGRLAQQESGVALSKNSIFPGC